MVEGLRKRMVRCGLGLALGGEMLVASLFKELSLIKIHVREHCFGDVLIHVNTI